MKKIKPFYFVGLAIILLINSSIYASNHLEEVIYQQVTMSNSSKQDLFDGAKSFLHDEIVGTFVFEQYSTELLLLTVTAEKKHFVHALKAEADCSSKDMMRVCGNKYLTKNFAVEVNSQKVYLKQESLSIQKDIVVLTYTIPITKQAIKKIEVTSDYMFEYNHHSILKVIFNLSGSTRTFNIKNKKRMITAKF